jgi:hypothetical protein
LKPDGFTGAVEANRAHHRGREEIDHVGDVHHCGFFKVEAATFNIDNGLSGGQQVTEPVDIGAVGQRDDDILVDWRTITGVA